MLSPRSAFRKEESIYSILDNHPEESRHGSAKRSCTDSCDGEFIGMNRRADAAAIATVSCFNPRFPQGITFLRMRKNCVHPADKDNWAEKANASVRSRANPTRINHSGLSSVRSDPCRQSDESTACKPMKISLFEVGTKTRYVAREVR